MVKFIDTIKHRVTIRVISSLVGLLILSIVVSSVAITPTTDIAHAAFKPGENEGPTSKTPPEEIERKIEEKKSRSQQQSTATPSSENDNNPTSPNTTVNSSNKVSDNTSNNTEDVSESQEVNKLGGWEWLAVGALGAVVLAGAGWVVMGRRKK